MRVREGPQHLQHDLAALLGFAAEVLALQVCGERTPEDAFHHQIDEVFLLAEVVHRHDVGVLQTSGRAGLHAKAREDGLGLVGVQPGLVDHLDGERALDDGVVGLIDDGGRARAELSADLVLADAFRQTHGTRSP